MNTRLILIRHGESEDNVAGRLSGWTDSGLTTIGVEQARRMARYVAGTYRPSALYASSLSRAVGTAEPLAQLTGLPITVRDDLRELHFGHLDGLTVPEILARFPSEWEHAQDEEDVTFRFPGGETRVEFYARVQRAFSDLIRSHAGETVAIVSHGGVLSSFLADVAEGKPQRWRSFLKDNCALSELLAQSDGVTIVRWNFTDYLKASLPQ